MKTKGEQFAGVTVALITPFRDGEIDFSELNGLVDWHVQQGTDCLSPVGTTGESPTLDHDEHERVIAAVADDGQGVSAETAQKILSALEECPPSEIAVSLFEEPRRG